MKSQTEGEVLVKTTKKSIAKDKLQVKGNVNLSIGFQIFGLENAPRREKVFRILVIVSLILIMLTVVVLTDNGTLANSLTKFVEKLLILLQTVLSSKELLLRVFKQIDTHNRQ
jgi:hypothetical protein